MNFAYLILGGNIGDKSGNLEKARKLIASDAGAITKKSEIFVTAPWGNVDQPEFYNQALMIETMLSPKELLETLLRIEASIGRLRDERKWAERIIDIDILFYNEAVIREEHLCIPHPHLAARRFVLAPLAQIAAAYIHPELGVRIDSLLNNCPDKSEIKPLSQALKN
jgi:2-amino-4-hydroxy-6-hydroxymethyldihydropteridine diphosphokinase